MYNHLAKYYDSVDLSRKATRSSLLRHIPDVSGLKALDVGCGTGISSVLLLAKGYEVDAIDLSPQMIQVAKTKAKSINWLVGDILTYNTSKRYGLILCANNILNHLQNISDLRAFFSKMHSLLSKNSILIFDLPKLEALQNNIPHCIFNDIEITNKSLPDNQFAQITEYEGLKEVNIIKYWESLFIYSLLREDDWQSIELKTSDTADIFIVQI